MARHTGQCSKCGSPAHPRGNVFRIMPSWQFELEYSDRAIPATNSVKVCNNCNTAHPFHSRTSAKRRAVLETIDSLLKESEQ